MESRSRPPRTERGGSSRRGPLLAVLVLLLLLLPTVVAYTVSQSRDPVYAARADVLFAGGSTQVPQRAEQQLRTQVALLGSRAFLIPTARSLNMDIEELQESLTVEQVADSEVLQVTVTDEDANRARRAAQSLVDTYIGNVGVLEGSEEEQQLLQGRLQELQARQAEVDARLAELEAQRAQRRIAGLPDPISPEQQRLESESRSLTQQIVDVQSRITELRLHDLGAEPSAAVVTPAYVVSDPVSPQPLRAAAAGLLAGTLLAGGTVVALRRRTVG